jgi:hypothetical protein
MLKGFPGTDVILELVLAINAEIDELLIQIKQAGGRDIVRRVNHLYRLEKPTSAGGYMVLPHGSGYLIPADCPDPLPGSFDQGGIIGARWTLPFFGMTRGDEGLCIFVDTWWDCDVEAYHAPGSCSTLDINWADTLGRLGYARRQRIRFSRSMDYVAMAKLYRRDAAEHGMLRTLTEKAEETPVLKQYVENVLVRWPAWNPALVCIYAGSGHVGDAYPRVPVHGPKKAAY